MKNLNIALLLGLIFCTPPVASAFHSGEAADCDGCHLSHPKPASASDFTSSFPDPGDDQSYLLRGSDPSSACLRCHAESLKVLSTDGSVYTPGGDFFWLTRSYSGRDGLSMGESHGHNVISRDYGLGGDALLPSSPSDGVVYYRSDWLDCTSCHDPHASTRSDVPYPPAAPASTNSGNYRLLGGVGYDGGRLARGISFTNPAPIAKAYPARDDQWPAETDRNHVDYGSGMSEWCVNCHSGFLGGSGQHQHPAGNHSYLGKLARFYNAYAATGKMDGNHATAYDHLVPFERGVTDPDQLSPISTAGPGEHSNVMCLTCHRAHASAFADIGRWDFKATLLADSGVFSLPEGAHAYYGDTIAERYQPFQRSLCNKCHVQD